MEKTRTVIRYKVFEIRHGLLLDPQNWGENKYSDYVSLKEAVEAIRECNGQGLFVLPQVFTAINH